jgi:mxaJ protein
MTMLGIATARSLDPGIELARRDTGYPVRLPVPGVLRVVVDPNNLPFSNARGEGFENAIAKLVARDLGCRVKWVWGAQRRGFVRNTLKAGLADVVMGVPADDGAVSTTHPYYRSSFAFVTVRGTRVPRGLDDPALARMRIGVRAGGSDAIVPAAALLATRGLQANVRGFPLASERSRPNPPAALLDALARGDIDVAIAWGPVAGWHAAQSPEPLVVTPIAPGRHGESGAFDIAVGVRHGESALRDAIDRSLARRDDAIRAILEDYGVPLVDATTVH